MKCPRCQVDLMITDRQGVEIDFCPQCRGVWLDRGELDKLVERVARFDDRGDDGGRRDRYPERPFDRDDDDDDRGYRRRKSFWSELFD